MARIRSPNYPQLSLPAALERVAQIFAKEHQHPAPKEVIVQHMGYNTLNGTSLAALSALSKYGLLEKAGSDLRVTSRAMAILHPSSEDEKREAVKEAALEPALFNDLLTHFEEQLPSDNNLQSHLIRRGFSPNAVTGVIEVLRETMEYADITSSAEAQERPVAAERKAVAAVLTRDVSVTASRGPTVSVTLEDDQLRVTAVLVDQKGIVKLIRVLEANKLLLPEFLDKEELVKPKVDITEPREE